MHNQKGRLRPFCLIAYSIHLFNSHAQLLTSKNTPFLKFSISMLSR